MGSNQSDVEVSYGVGNDFFKLWLDENMNYTCALFEDEENFSDPLDVAQNNKLRRLSQFAKINDKMENILDIGCGWGANLAHQVLVNKVRHAHGVTLSRQQYEYCLARHLPRTTLTCGNFLEYTPPVSFDGTLCIGMMEHLVSPEEARKGQAVSIYRNFFKKAHGLMNPDSFFALQSITRQKIPRRKKELSDMRHATYVMFPNAVVPRIEDLVMAAPPYFEVMDMRAIRFHYKKTTWLWRDGLRKNEDIIRKKWGAQIFEGFDRYLSTCITGFDKNWFSLHQFSLRRLD